MTIGDADHRERWQHEISARNRWGGFGEDKVREEIGRLHSLWTELGPGRREAEPLIGQIIAVDLCSWRLESDLVDLCRAIGSKRPTVSGTGYRYSMTNERWLKVWGYYLAARRWLGEEERPDGYAFLLGLCDIEGATSEHVHGLLGKRTALKSLYVELFCLFLEFALRGSFPAASVQLKAHEAARAAIIGELESFGYDRRIVRALTPVRDGGYALYPGLELFHHKLFRRFDIILSSIGAGRWRAAMPVRGTDGEERAELVRRYLDPMVDWLERGKGARTADPLVYTIVDALGERDGEKRFLVSLLISLLRSQELSARLKMREGVS